MTIRGLIDGARDGSWLTRRCVIAGGQVLLLAQATILVLLALWQHGVITGAPSNTSSDFVSFYAAGKLALAGTPALAYDQAAHYLMQQRFTAAGAPYQFFFYPPVFLLLFAPIALLPYYAAFYLFEIVTLAAFLLVVRLILREPGWAWTAPVLAFPAVFWTFGLGQNAFLTAALFGGAALLLERRPAIAGMLLGLLCYKPHFGLLAPAALLCGRHWRAFGAAAVTVAALVGVSVMLFGVETWRAYIGAMAAADAVYGSGRIDYAGIVTPFGAARLLGIGAPAAYAVQAVVTGAMLLLTGAVWRSRANLETRAATLAAATLLAVPLALLYDQMLLLICAAFLLRDASRNGFLPWEKTALLVGFFGSIVEYVVGSAWLVPLGPAISVLLLVLTVRRGWRALPWPRAATEVGRPARAAASAH